MELASENESTTCRRPSNEEEDTLLLLHRQLEEFVGISKDNSTQRAAANFVAWLGCGSLEELAVFCEEDLRGYLKEYNNNSSSNNNEEESAATPTSTIPPICQTKLVLAAKHLQRGATLPDLRGLIGTSTTNRGGGGASSSSSSRMIHLQVGEDRFTTKQRTLCRFEGSYFHSMFSGRLNTCPVPAADGTLVHFIDRSGKYFEYVLEYLRFGGVVSEVLSPTVRDAVAVEADFYGLDGLARALRAPKTATAMFLDESTLRLQAEEEDIRARCVRGDETLDRHEGLLPLFHLATQDDRAMPIRYDPQLKDSVSLLFDKKRRKLVADSEVTVSSIDQFRTNFNRSHPNVLHRLNDVLLSEPVIVAGGSVLGSLRCNAEDSSSRNSEESDVDLFICTSNTLEANRITQRIWNALAVDNEAWWILRGPGVVNMVLWERGGWRDRIVQKVQIVLRLYDSPAEVLYGFDVDCCCCCYDGREVWATPRCSYALQSMANIVNPLHAWPNRASYELRLAKYATRGFAIAIPGLDETRVDKDYVNSTAMGNLRGLARVFKAELEMERDLVAARDIDDPLRADGLKPEAKRCLNPLTFIVKGYAGWDTDRPTTAIIPSVYEEDGEEASPIMFIYPEPRPSSETRDAAWSEIVSYDHPTDDGVPSTLLESWDCSKRSREYLNSLADKDELDHFYYSGAYDAMDKPPVESAES